MDTLMRSIEHALNDNKTDVEALKELFVILKQEYPLVDIDEAYNDVIRSAIYE